MNKTPKINWNAGTEQIDNVRMPYISECVRYGNCVGVYMVVGRREDETVPQKFCYSLALDVDTTQQITISFQKRRRHCFSCRRMSRQTSMAESVIHMPNIVALSNSAIPLNLFQAHIVSDTVVFGYTSTDGTRKEFRFPLTGFNERYLEQFI